MVMYINTSKLNSTLGTTGKATGVKMTAKAVGKNSNFCVIDFKVLTGLARLLLFPRVSLYLT